MSQGLTKKERERLPYRLLVEGTDDKFVIAELSSRFELPQNFNIVDKSDVNQIILQLSTELKNPVVEVLGLVLDADDKMNEYWKALKKILEEEGYVVPNHPDAAGTILSQPNLKKIGIWLMPDNEAEGYLEHFVHFLIPEHDDLVGVVKDTLDTLENTGKHRYRMGLDRAKAEIHTWLAWSKEPGIPMGRAIQRKFLQPDTEKVRLTCQNFVNWLNNLFNS